MNSKKTNIARPVIVTDSAIMMGKSGTYVRVAEQSSVLLASSTGWPVTAKLAVALLQHGCKVHAVCPPDHPLSFVSEISTIYPYRVLDSWQSLHDAITATAPEMVIPCDDGVVWQLHELYRLKPELRPLIERSLGSASGYDIVASRQELMELAQELRIRTPQTKRVGDATDLLEWFCTPGISGVLKLDGTCAGKGVRVAHSLAEAQQALVTMLRPANAFMTAGRLLVLQDPLAVWNWRQRKRPEVTVQQFIAGRPANTMMVCRGGKVLAMVTVEVLWAQSRTGAAVAVRLIENDEIRIAAERIAERLKLSGFHGLDFILEEATGHAYLIELNPRCTQLGHLQIRNQGDLAGVFCRAFTNARSPRSPRPISEEIITFFPQVLMSNPICPHLESAHIDVPWTEPRLVRELMRRDWRNRRLIARLYYALQPKNPSAVDFETTVDFDEAEVRELEIVQQDR